MESAVADKTKISIDVSFDKKVKLSHVASGKLQKEKDGLKTTKTLGVTKPSAAVESPVLHWDEVTDPINKTKTLAIKEVSAKVVYSTRVWIDKAIGKKHDCYKHVFEHEKRHVKVWQAGVKKYAKDIIKAVDAVTTPKLGKPVEVKDKAAAKVREEAFKRIDKALADAVQKYGKKIGDESKKKIDTSSERKKTNAICADYLK